MYTAIHPPPKNFLRNSKSITSRRSSNFDIFPNFLFLSLFQQNRSSRSIAWIPLPLPKFILFPDKMKYLFKPTSGFWLVIAFRKGSTLHKLRRNFAYFLHTNIFEVDSGFLILSFSSLFSSSFISWHWTSTRQESIIHFCGGFWMILKIKQARHFRTKLLQVAPMSRKIEDTNH